MTAFEEIERARSTRLVTEDDDPVELTLLPPLSDDEIGNIERSAGVALSTELKDLLHQCGGLDDVLELDFSGRSFQGFGYEELFPHPLPIAHDGFGNYWVVDLTSEARERAPIYFACHDAPVVLYQSPDLAQFVREYLRMYIPPHESLVDDVHEDRLFRVWRDNPGTMSQDKAVLSGDPELKSFAESLDARFTLVDLRQAEIGMGFSWGRYGPNTIVRRSGELPLYGYAAPERRGLWTRLTGQRR